MTRLVKAKAVLAATGLGLGLAGMALDSRPLVWVAVGVLVAAFLLRFLQPRVPVDADQSSPRG